MILSEWRLNIHFFSVHCNLLNVNTPKEQFSGPFLTSLKKKYPLIHLLCFLTAIKLIIHIYHTFKGAQWHAVYKPLDNKVLGILTNVEGEGATLECLQGGLCVFQGNLVFLTSRSECKIVHKQ